MIWLLQILQDHHHSKSSYHVTVQNYKMSFSYNFFKDLYLFIERERVGGAKEEGEKVKQNPG